MDMKECINLDNIAHFDMDNFHHAISPVEIQVGVLHPSFETVNLAKHGQKKIMADSL